MKTLAKPCPSCEAFWKDILVPLMAHIKQQEQQEETE
jgi:hypothetical protein